MRSQGVLNLTISILLLKQITTAVFSEVLLLSSKGPVRLRLVSSKKAFSFGRNWKNFWKRKKRKTDFIMQRRNKNKEKPAYLKRMTCPWGKRSSRSMLCFLYGNEQQPEWNRLMKHSSFMQGSQNNRTKTRHTSAPLHWSLWANGHVWWEEVTGISEAWCQEADHYDFNTRLCYMKATTAYTGGRVV